MSIPSQSIQSELDKLKKTVQDAANYFEDNTKRFHAYKKFTFVDSLIEPDKRELVNIGKPTLSFNVLESYISRLCGEFAIMNLQVDLTPKDSQVPSQLVDVLRNIIRGIFYQSDSDNLNNMTYKNCLGGGYSVMKIWTEYENENSFDQIIKMGKVFDPTLCVFDPYARQPHKGDGRYCAELIPLKEDEFKYLYPNVQIENMNFSNASQFGFKWQFSTDTKEKVIYVCDYYEKKTKRVMKHLLSNGKIVTTDEYNQVVEETNNSLEPTVAPIKIKSEMRDVKKIVRYRFIQNMVLEYEETDYNYLPLVFIDGNSVIIDNQQITRPYVYHAYDAQRAKNVVANSLFDEIMNLRRTTIIASERSLPEDTKLLKAYLEPQKQYSAMIYNDYDMNLQQPINPPTVFPRAPIPPELFQMFNALDSSIQNILGAYDAQQGDIADRNLSGRAIVAGATQSNSAAKPYIINFIASMNHVARILVDLIPKYYVTPRTLPMIDKLGKRYYQVINNPNDPNSMQLKYDPNIFDVYVDAGPSFEMQKKESLNQLISLSQANQGINQLLSSPEGVDVLLENLDINGSDKLSEINEQMQEQQQNQPPQPNPQMIMMQQQQTEMQQKAQQAQLDSQIKMSELKLKQDAQNMDSVKMQHQIMQDYISLATERERAQAEVTKAQDEAEKADAELRLKQVDQAFDHYQFMVNKFKELKNEEKPNMQ